MNKDKIIILGSGSSVGVPRIDGYWGRANKNDLKNKITKIDNVIYTHEHADQTHGINELRPFFWKNKKKIIKIFCC